MYVNFSLSIWFNNLIYLIEGQSYSNQYKGSTDETYPTNPPFNKPQPNYSTQFQPVKGTIIQTTPVPREMTIMVPLDFRPGSTLTAQSPDGVMVQVSTDLLSVFLTVFLTVLIYT